MSDSYKLQYDGMTLTYPGWNGYVSYEYSTAFKTLTLYNSEGGTLTANKLTGYPGETINLTTAYDTYWRFSGYQLTGDGSLVGNDYTFGNEDASICACYKVNAFTATGGWEQGSNEGIINYNKDPGITVYLSPRYAIRNASTGDIPTSWYATSNRWNPSNASAYKITLNPKMRFFAGGNSNASYATTGCTKVGSTIMQSQSWNGNFPGSKGTYMNYSKSFTSTTQGYYMLSAILTAWGGKYTRANNYYVATGTTGTWTATGIAP